jgi:hypothetical protein
MILMPALEASLQELAGSDQSADRARLCEEARKRSLRLEPKRACHEQAKRARRLPIRERRSIPRKSPMRLRVSPDKTPSLGASAFTDATP